MVLAQQFGLLEIIVVVAYLGLVGWLGWLGRSSCEASQRTISAGDAVTMTCTLRNDGQDMVNPASLQVALPEGVELISGTMYGGLIHHPAARLLAWSGRIPPAGERLVRFGLQTAPLLPGAADIPLMVRIGYANHGITYEHPYLLHLDRPDLSTSTLDLSPTAAHPGETITAALILRNTGVRTAQVAATVEAPICAFLGRIADGGSGTTNLDGPAMTWQGTVAAGQQLTLTYPLTLCPTSDYILVHQVQVADGHGETWWPRAYAHVNSYRSLLPWASRAY